MSVGIVLPKSDQCAFCEYLSGSRPYVFAYRDPEIAIAVTLEQRGLAHLLVLPVEHHETIMALPDRLTGPLMAGVRDAAEAIVGSMKPDGIAVWQNNGMAAAQKIAHVHFHVAGTLPGGGTEFGPVPEISLDDAQAIASRLIPFLRTDPTT